MKSPLTSVSIYDQDYRVVAAGDLRPATWAVSHEDRIIWIGMHTPERNLPGVVGAAGHTAWNERFSQVFQQFAIDGQSNSKVENRNELAFIFYRSAGICWDVNDLRWVCPVCLKPFKTYPWFTKHVEGVHQLDGLSLMPRVALTEAA